MLYGRESYIPMFDPHYFTVAAEARWREVVREVRRKGDRVTRQCLAVKR